MNSRRDPGGVVARTVFDRAHFRQIDHENTIRRAHAFVLMAARADAERIVVRNAITNADRDVARIGAISDRHGPVIETGVGDDAVLVVRTVVRVNDGDTWRQCF